MPEHQRSLNAELQELFLVALGAVPGALLRWQVALHGSDRHLLVNVAGAALLGFIAGLPAAPRRQLLIGIGFCGSLTTFSSWMLDAMRLMSSGKIVEALGLIGLTLGLGVGAAALGFWVGQRVRPPTPPRSEP
ncbi:CrcB family protein [Synechococcus sp. AH-551-E02]|nr:CrcB family protein [Synechococcus sp. AH-551-E02]MDB4653701.1 CrcB family protein [Synechococcus sp. AH-551-E02]